MTIPSLKRTLAAVALMAAHNMTPADCFGAVATVETPTSSSSSSRTTSTQRFFTVDENLSSESIFYNPMIASQFQTRSSVSSSSAASASAEPLSFQQDRLPSWLRLEKAHLLHPNMERLRSSMRSSFFTESEVLKLNYAIQEAAGGDAQRMAGAAEFCHIMVETMEMGLNALIAAAFHYSHCVDARQVSCALPHRDLTPWAEDLPHHGIESFGKHALAIERDAARLKRLEMVASMVHSNNSHRVTPDEQEADNLRNLFLTEAKDWRALAIRGAACLYRLRGIITADEEKVTKETGRVCREALRIYAPIASRLGMHRLKNELEEAAFRILYRRQYETVSALLHQTRDSDENLHRARREARFGHTNAPDISESMGQILSQVQAEMTQVLENDPVFSHSVEDFTVTARVKESYSTWKKMLRNRFDHILQVPDALALRIVLNSKKENPYESDEVTRARERALCYYAQKLCMERWAPHADDARFKDYIAHPKFNGYQSLHYTASTEWHGEEWNMEIQVRSGEMHKVAEFGVASHWDYKVRGKPKTLEEEEDDDYEEEHSARYAVSIKDHFGKVPGHHTDAYLQSLQEWHWDQHGDYSSTTEDEDEATVEPLILGDENDSQLRMERIRARTERLAPYIEALAEAQSDLARENVFVFLHQSKKDVEGTVVALPAGSRVLDAIRYCELPAAAEALITHNGEPASLRNRLVNGDVLSLPSLSALVTQSM
jgi:ppGpp synthetase/RelA/SpoT-type nucleotidyltranferase